MAAATRTRPSKKTGESAHRQRPSCYVLLTKRVTHKPGPEPTTRRTRSQSAAAAEVKPVTAKATRKGKGKAKVQDEGARTPTQVCDSQADLSASSTRKPPPPPRHVHLGKPAVSFEEARDDSRMTTPDEGRETANAGSGSERFVPFLLHDTDNAVLEDMSEPELCLAPPGARDGDWRIKRTSPPPVLPRDYPFADPSSARKSPPPRVHPHRIGKPPMPDSSEGEGDGADTEPALSDAEHRVNVTLGSTRFERTLQLSTPVRPHAQRRHSPPRPPQPPSESGTPKIPPSFRRDDTASPHRPRTSMAMAQMSHRKLIAEASLRRRQQHQQTQPVSPLPPSSEPTDSPSAASERVVQDTSIHNLSHDAFWPGDEGLYAGSDPGEHYPDVDEENIQVAASHRHAHSETRVVDVLGVGRTLAPEESFETPRKPRRYNIRPPATQNTKDEATAALFAPDMSDESGVSNILDYVSVAAKRMAEEERRRDSEGFESGAEEAGAYVPIEGDDSIMGYEGYSPAQGGSDKENQGGGYEEEPATAMARRTGIPEPDNRGFLQPRAGEGVYTSPARHRGGAEDDPFGILATEALLRARRAYSSAMKPAPKTSAAATASIARAEAARASAPASKPPNRVLARSASGRTLVDAAPAGRRIPFGQRSFQDLNPPTTPGERDRFADLDLPPSSPPRAEEAEVNSPARSHRSATMHDSIEDLYTTPPSERGDFVLVLSTPVRAPRVVPRPQAQMGSDNSIPAFDSSPAHTPRKDRDENQRTPMTPRNRPRDRGSVTMRRHKSHAGLAENEEYDGRGEFEGPREPSPSPVKARPSNVHIPELDDEDEGEETETEMPKKLSGKGKGKAREVSLIEPKTKGKENTGRARGRKRKSDEAGIEDEDPELVTRRLEDMLPRPRAKVKAAKPDPKKSTRPAAKKARRQLAEDSDGDGEEKEVQRSSSLPGSPVKKARKRGATYGGARARQRRKGLESTPEEVREDRQRRRKERVEYYKGLEGYRLRKEKVYVV